MDRPRVVVSPVSIKSLPPSVINMGDAKRSREGVTVSVSMGIM